VAFALSRRVFAPGVGVLARFGHHHGPTRRAPAPPGQRSWSPHREVRYHHLRRCCGPPSPLAGGAGRPRSGFRGGHPQRPRPAPGVQQPRSSTCYCLTSIAPWLTRANGSDVDRSEVVGVDGFVTGAAAVALAFEEASPHGCALVAVQTSPELLIVGCRAPLRWCGKWSDVPSHGLRLDRVALTCRGSAHRASRHHPL
jgi:hypothetical protein